MYHAGILQKYTVAWETAHACITEGTLHNNGFMAKLAQQWLHDARYVWHLV
jgi:hypothetical protein